MRPRAARKPPGLNLHAFLAVIAALSLALCLLPARAQQTAEYASKAKQAVLMEATTGAILYQNNAEARIAPSSMTMLMTLAVAFKKLKEGSLKLSDEFTMSENAWRKGGAPSRNTAMFVPINTKATVDELIQGVAVQIGHDAAMCLAEGIAGNEAEFAKLMEAEAKRIGLRNSQFRNATGLFHAEHVMTARDLAVLARHIINEYPDRYPVFSQKEFFYRKHKFYSRNPLANVVPGVDGLMTGYIKEGGYGMVASAVQEGRRLIAVVSGLQTENERRDEARKLFEWGYKGFSEYTLFGDGETVGFGRVWGGDRMYVPLTGKGELKVLLPRSQANQRLRGEIVYLSPLKAPIAKGDEVATLRVTNASGATNEVPLFAAETVNRGGIMRRGLDSLVHMAFGWVAL